MTLRRCATTMDTVIARELGADLGRQFDRLVLNGTGTNSQTLGITNVAGTLAVTYTDASPTAAETVTRVWQAYATLADPATGYGTADPDAYVVLLHPRRFGYISANAGGQVDVELPGTVVPTAGIRTDVGGTEDHIVVLDRTQTFIRANAPVFRLDPDIGSGSLTIRIQAWQAMNVMAGKSPNSIAIVSGSGLVPPTFA